MSDVSRSEHIDLLTGAKGLFLPASDPDSRLSALIVHGWKSLPTSSGYLKVLQGLAGLGYNTLLLSLRGHGEAEGNINTVSRQDHSNDIMAAHNYLERRFGKFSIDLGVGTSYGAYLLAYFSDRFRAISLRSPALYPESGFSDPTLVLMTANLQEWRQECLLSFNNDPALAGVEVYRGPLFVYWGGQDEQIPQPIFEAYCDHAVLSQVTRVIESRAGHVLTREQFNLWLKLLLLWAERQRTTPSSER